MEEIVIPKRAIFFWDGLPMSWLREQSIATFRELNPTWEIDLIHGDGIPIRGSGRLECVLRSDWARYRRLHEVGGVYFDTDIVFCRPFPEEWLENDAIVPMGEHQQIGHVAVLGGKPKFNWFYLLDKACELSFRGDQRLNYQHFGVGLVNGLSPAVIGSQIKWLEPDTFMPVHWAMPEAVWSDSGALSPLTYGVHWYGGDWLSISQEAQVDAEWGVTSSSLLAKAWRKAMCSEVRHA